MKRYGLKLCDEASKELVGDALSLYQDLNWHTENTAREKHQLAIYGVSECLSCNFLSQKKQHSRLKILAEKMAEELIVSGIVSNDFVPIYSELNILLPSKTIPWHHDRMKRHSLSLRFSLPLTDDQEIDYFFSSWAANTPRSRSDFAAHRFLANDARKYKMKMGFFHLFNHRVPHSTVSRSSHVRPILVVDMMHISKLKEITIGAEGYAPISEEERLPLLE